MKKFVMRGSTLGLVIMIGFFSAIFISFSLYGMYIFSIEDTPPALHILGDVLLFVLFAFGTAILYQEVFAYFHKITIDEETITWQKPFRKRKSFPLSQLSAWGCVSYAPRSTMIFFCTEDTSTLLSYLEAHRTECMRIFGTDRCKLLESTPAEHLQLAVGTYIRQHLSGTNNLLILRYGSVRRLKALVCFLKRDAMLTGPWLLDKSSGWDHVNRYRH